MISRLIELFRLAPRRAVAGALAAIVFGLGLLAVAPAAHEHLHADAHHGEHTCAVVLFAQGVLATGVALLLAAPMRHPSVALVMPAPVGVADPARRLPPACGPPWAE